MQLRRQIVSYRWSSSNIWWFFRIVLRSVILAWVLLWKRFWLPYRKAAIFMQAPVYRRRDPQNSPYYQCVEDHFETFEMIYDDRFERQYGFFRPYVNRSFTAIWPPARRAYASERLRSSEERLCQDPMWELWSRIFVSPLMQTACFPSLRPLTPKIRLSEKTGRDWYRKLEPARRSLAGSWSTFVS